MIYMCNKFLMRFSCYKYLQTTCGEFCVTVWYILQTPSKLTDTFTRTSSRGQDVIPWDLLAEIDFFVLSYSLTLS